MIDYAKMLEAKVGEKPTKATKTAPPIPDYAAMLREALVQKRRAEGHCETWPDCPCRVRQVGFAVNCIEANDLQPMFDTLTCMTRRCPDAEEQSWAAKQLAHRVFDRVRTVRATFAPEQKGKKQ